MKIAHSESQRKFPHISFISGSRIRESAAVEYGQKSKLSAGTERQYHTNKCYSKDMLLHTSKGEATIFQKVDFFLNKW